MIEAITSATATSAVRANLARAGAAIGSAELAGDVFLRELLARAREHILGRPGLDEVARAAALGDVYREEGGDVGHALRLLHVVGHDGDRVVFLELQHQLLD